ncbi:MAG TPA: ABC transporter permease, partial [Oceanipulchritudo sp.]|nr:ABC transporter permease [Oceanipulchritudo sp.]
MDAFLTDFRYAFRVLFKRPGLTLLAILALAVSLGMSTTAFSTLNGIFFKPLPFKDPDSLQQIYLRNTKADLREIPIPYEQFVELQGADSFSDVMAYFSGTINISGKGLPERYDGTFVSTNFLEVLGHAPAIGRTYSEASYEWDGPRELLISHAMWRDRYRQDPDIVGTKVLANAVEHTIVGVLPEGFEFPGHSQVWMPINETLLKGERKLISHVIALGRLAPGVTNSEAKAELETYFQGWGSQAVENKEDAELVCEPFGRLQLNRASQSFLVVAMAAVIFVL